jgi:hypothetical protein
MIRAVISLIMSEITSWIRKFYVFHNLNLSNLNKVLFLYLFCNSDKYFYFSHKWVRDSTLMYIYKPTHMFNTPLQCTCSIHPFSASLCLITGWILIRIFHNRCIIYYIQQLIKWKTIWILATSSNLLFLFFFLWDERRNIFNLI